MVDHRVDRVFGSDTGYERMTSPVRDLLNFYRRLSMMRVQYRLVADAFA